jgi:hypothetical protein
VRADKKLTEFFGTAKRDTRVRGEFDRVKALAETCVRKISCSANVDSATRGRRLRVPPLTDKLAPSKWILDRESLEIRTGSMCG